MDKFRVLEIKKSIFEDNDHEADLLRAVSYTHLTLPTT